MILGISLNSRTLGMAVLDGQSLVDYQIRLFKEAWTTEKLGRIISCISSYRQEYPVQQVSLVVPANHHSSPEIKKLITQVKIHCKKRKLPLCCYKANALEALCEEARAKKKALMQALSLLYPELSLAQKKEQQNKKRYYSKLFEAVGVATLQAQEMECSAHR